MSALLTHVGEAVLLLVFVLAGAMLMEKLEEWTDRGGAGGGGDDASSTAAAKGAEHEGSKAAELTTSGAGGERKRKQRIPDAAAIHRRRMRMARKMAHKVINLGLIITSGKSVRATCTRESVYACVLMCVCCNVNPASRLRFSPFLTGSSSVLNSGSLLE